MKFRLLIACFIMSAGLAVIAGDSIPGVITTIAGNGTPGSGGDGGPATSAQLDGIMGTAVDSAGNLYIADENTDTIRKVTPDGVISTAVGTSAGLRNPSDVAVDAMGNLYIADSENCSVVKVTPGGAISTLAHMACYSVAVASDPAGNVYVGTATEWEGSAALWKVSPDGSAPSLITRDLYHPAGLALDAVGNLYVANYFQVLKVDAQGRISVVAGNGTGGFSGDGGPALSAKLDAFDVAVDSAGNLFVAGWRSFRIRMVSPAGIITTVAGNGTEGFSGDGGPATSAQLSFPNSVAVDRAGNLLIGDRGNRRIRKVTRAVGSETFFPQVAVGGGYSTTFTLANTGDSAISGDLILTDQQGQPLTTSGAGVGAGSSFPVSIAPAGTMFLTVNPLDPGDPLKRGWATVATAGGVLHGVATSQLLSQGALQAATGVFMSQPMRYATIPVDDDYSQGRLTAYALANPTSQNLVIKLALVDQDGRVVNDTVTLRLAPKEQIARYLYQDLARSQFKGSMVLRAQEGGSFVAAALVQHQKLSTVIPVIPGKAASVPD